jgi:hypothetical protein
MKSIIIISALVAVFLACAVMTTEARLREGECEGEASDPSLVRPIAVCQRSLLDAHHTLTMHVLSALSSVCVSLVAVCRQCA